MKPWFKPGAEIKWIRPARKENPFYKEPGWCSLMKELHSAIRLKNNDYSMTVMTTDNEMNFRRIIEEMNDTYKRKNADYGNSFDETIDMCGLGVAAGRMYDKWKRFLTLLENASRVDDESIIDTLTDLANYAVMTRMYIENHSQKREVEADERGSDNEASARINRKYYKEAEE